MNKINKHLRLGRVYHIAPDPIPPYTTSKEREAVYVGRIIVKNKKMNVFIQMGSSKYFDKSLVEFSKNTRYFWDKMNREGYFHLASSKPEYVRVVKNAYIMKNNYVELSQSDAKKLKNIWQEKIEELENQRWKKAYGNYILGKREESLRQLYLLKYTMPWKHKFLKPLEHVIEKWEKKEKENIRNKNQNF